MPNAWDGLSALMLADVGFEAIATSSRRSLARSAGPTGVTKSPVASTSCMHGSVSSPGCPSTETSRTATATRLKTSLPSPSSKHPLGKRNPQPYEKGGQSQ
ncbi:hypothetical protein [Streptomyces acidicola]|uniref:hypothetical protein n=1 Tax=Streptomyces acidicola TaxID=2596892 RepID=UPI00342A5724